MSELNEEKQKVLERLMRDAERSENIPESERRPVRQPTKYSFPIGMKDNGELFIEEEVDKTLKEIGLR